MPSTYTVNLGIEKPATGEQSGTWGDTTNVNFDIIDQAVNGSERVTLVSAGTSGSPNDLNIVNGSTTSSEGRNKWIEIYSASDLGGSAYVRLVPNDAEKILFIRNSLAGSRSVLLFQGTYNASNDLEIPAGVDMVVKFDGGGASATVTDVFTKLRATEITTPTLTAATADINGGSIDGATVGAASASSGAFTTLTASTSLNIASSTTVDGVLDEDNMASNSATKLATQQSIKAYVDSQVGTVDTLAEILANGNTSGANNLIINSGQALTANTINETTAGSGVTIDSVLLKDDVVNATDIETSTISANDGTAAATIANSTGNFTITNFISNSVDIGGGAIDGTNIGASSAGTGAFTTLSASGDLAVDTNILYVDTTNDRVGIQTSTPSTPLDVRSSLSTVYTGTAQSAEHINIFNTATGAVGLTSGIRFQTRALDATGQSFFIGATATSGGYAPNFKFQKQTGSTTYQELAALNVSETVFNDPGNNYDFRVESDTNANVLFVDASSDRVGILNNNPAAPLDVTGGIAAYSTTIADSGIQVRALGNNTDANKLRLHNNGADVSIGRNIATWPGTWDKADDTVGSGGWVIGSDGNAGFYQSDAGDTNPLTYDRLRIYAGGNVVVNEGSTDSDFRVESDTSSSALFVDAGASNVGINNSGPTSSLNVGNNKSFVWNNTGIENVATLLVGNRTIVDSQNAFAVAGTTHNTYYPAAFVIDSQYNGFGTNSTNFDLTSYGVNYAGWNGSMRLRVSQNTGVHEAIRITPTETTFNELSNDTDFRVESDNNTHMLFVDAGNNRVGIGKSPSYYLDVVGSSQIGDTLYITSNGGANLTQGHILISSSTSDSPSVRGQGVFMFNEGVDRTWYAGTGYNAGGDYHIGFADDTSATTEGARVTNAVFSLYNGASGAVFNENSADRDFRVESDSNANMLVVDAGNNVVAVGASTSTATLGVHSGVDGTEAAPHFVISGAASTYRLSMWLDATAAYIGQDSTIRAVRIYSGAETAGVALTNGATSWSTFSDERLKENVEPIENALQSLSGLRTVKYHLKDVDGPEDKKKIGVIAQDLVGVLDEVIDPTFRPDDDTEYMGVRYTELVPVLIKAIQEQQNLIESLTARVVKLESN